MKGKIFDYKKAQKNDKNVILKKETLFKSI